MKYLFALTSLLVLTACSPTRPLVVLDSGHNPRPSELGAGAMSIIGADEVVYNDYFSFQLARSLTQAGFDVKFTRTPQVSQSLAQRYQYANTFKDNPKAIFISIHHDSTDLRNLQPIKVGNITTYQTTRPIAGSSFHVSAKSAKYAQSLQLATAIATQVVATGRKVNHDHASKIALLEPALGIYNHENLAVLKNNQLPAILIELGVIVDKDDEALMRDPKQINELSESITQGVIDFYQHRD